MLAIHAVSGMGWMLGCWPMAQTIADVADRGAPMMKIGRGCSTPSRCLLDNSNLSFLLPQPLQQRPLPKGALQFRAQIVHVFHANAQPHQIVGNTEFSATLRRN